MPSTILEVYFRFRFWPFRPHRRDILHRRTKFRPNRLMHGGLTSYRFFKMATGSHVGFLMRVIGPTMKCNADPSLRVDRIYSFGYNIAILRFWRFALHVVIFAAVPMPS